MNDKTTPWFSADVKPARDGVYQVRIRGVTKYARWDTGLWHLALRNFGSARGADLWSIDCYVNDGRFGGWRGLAEQPQ